VQYPLFKSLPIRTTRRFCVPTPGYVGAISRRIHTGRLFPKSIRSQELASVKVILKFVSGFVVYTALKFPSVAKDASSPPSVEDKVAGFRYDVIQRVASRNW
jgi:hypothetical protein